jgi:hypothetical protein
VTSANSPLGTAETAAVHEWIMPWLTSAQFRNDTDAPAGIASAGVARRRRKFCVISRSSVKEKGSVVGAA